jgi:hypothetical protein
MLEVVTATCPAISSSDYPKIQMNPMKENGKIVQKEVGIKGNADQGIGRKEKWVKSALFS